MNGRDEELLSAYFDGELPDEEKSRAEQLLTDNVAAREVLDEVAEVSGWIRELPRTAAPASVHDAVLARIRTSTAALPFKPAPARTSWRRWASWTAVSAAGLLVAAVLYRHEFSPEANRPVNARFALRESKMSADALAPVASEFDASRSERSFTVAAAPVTPPPVDPVQVAMSNSVQFQDTLAEMLRNGQAPVAGEEFTNLSQVGDLVVAVKYRIVDVEKLPGEVQLVLTNNGIAEVPGLKAGLSAFDDKNGAQKLDAFYVEASGTSFTSAIADISNLDGVTAVSANNFVSTEAASASGDRSDTQAGALSEKSERLGAVRDESVRTSRSDQPVPEPAFAPLSVSNNAPVVSEESKRAAEAGATFDFAASEEGRFSGSESAPPADGYQVAVTARPALIEELKEQKALFFDANEGVDPPARPAVPQQQVARQMQNRFWGLQKTQVQGPPAVPNRVRAVIVLVPDQPQ